jgi:hypothetical protein
LLLLPSYQLFLIFSNKKYQKKTSRREKRKMRDKKTSQHGTIEEREEVFMRRS